MKNLKWVLGFLLSVMLLSIALKSHAAFENPLTTIELDNSVHFLAPDGSDLLVETGAYTIESAEDWIRLIAGERHNALLIEAKKGVHELELEHSMAISIPGNAEGQADHHYVMLLLPGGNSLEATGTYSGIRARGIFKKAFSNVKKQANTAYKKTRSTVKKATSKAKKTGKQARKQVKKSAKQIRSQVKKGTQTVRNAALQAKKHVEKTARRVADKVKKGVQTGMKAVTNTQLVAKLQSEIQTLQAVRKLKLESLFGCMAQTTGQSSANLGQLVQRFVANPAGFASWMVNDFSTLLEKSFRGIMSEQLQLLNNPPRSNLPGAQVLDMAIRSMDKLAQKHPAGRCLLQFSQPHRTAFRNASVQLQKTINTKIKRIFDNHIAPVLYGSLNKQLEMMIKALLTLSPQDLAQSRIRSRGINTADIWQGELILPKDGPEQEIVSRGLRPINSSEGKALLKDLVGLGDIITVTRAILADHLLNPRELYVAASHIEKLSKSLNNQADRRAALGEVKTALSPYSPWTEALYIDIGMEILRVVGNNYLDSDLPGGGTYLTNLGVGIAAAAIGGVGDVGSGIGGLVPEVGAAVVVSIKIGPELSKDIVLNDVISASIVGLLHFTYNTIIDEAKDALKSGKSYETLQRRAGPLKALLRVLPGKQVVMKLADTHTKDMKKALVRYNQSVVTLAEAAAQ